MHPYIILDRPEYIPHLVLLMILVPVMYITVFKVLWAQMKLFDAAEKNRTLIMQVKMATDLSPARLPSGGMQISGRGT